MTNYTKTPIYDYTGDGYERINIGLRKKAKIKNEYFINYGLRKLKKFSGETYRSAVLDESIIKSYLKNFENSQPIIELAFLSSTKNFRIATGSFPGNVIYKIVSKNGKNVTKISMHPYEDEVLFSSKTRFKISNILYDARLKIYNIDLFEI